VTATEAETITLLKAMLLKRHLQEHKAFCRAYDRIAKQIDQTLVGKHPAKATFYRWMGGGVRKLPHPDHCRVLEHMFPGIPVTDMLKPWDIRVPLPEPRSAEPSPSPLNGQGGRAHYGDLIAAYANRAEFAHHMPPHMLFDSARTIQAAGLSLNLICQGYSDERWRSLLRQGTRMQCLFLDPAGDAIRAREREESYAEGDLSGLTRLNIQCLRRLRDELPTEHRDQVDLRTYDQTLRFNITIVDGIHCAAQPYLPSVRGVDSPTLVLRRLGDGSGMFPTFESVFTNLWEQGRACA
jgi:hypothetical protein